MQLVLAFNDHATDVDVNLLLLVGRLKLVCRIHDFQINSLPRRRNSLSIVFVVTLVLYPQLLLIYCKYSLSCFEKEKKVNLLTTMSRVNLW